MKEQLHIRDACRGNPDDQNWAGMLLKPEPEPEPEPEPGLQSEGVFRRAITSPFHETRLEARGVAQRNQFIGISHRLYSHFLQAPPPWWHHTGRDRRMAMIGPGPTQEVQAVTSWTETLRKSVCLVYWSIRAVKPVMLEKTIFSRLESNSLNSKWVQFTRRQ